MESIVEQGVLSLQPAEWHPSPKKTPRPVSTLMRGAVLPAEGIEQSVTILTFTILDQACNRGYFCILARRSSSQCLKMCAIGVAALGLYSLAGRSIFCSSPDCLCI